MFFLSNVTVFPWDCGHYSTTYKIIFQQIDKCLCVLHQDTAAYIFVICKPKTESKMAATCRIRLFVGAEVVNSLQVIIKMNEN